MAVNLSLSFGIPTTQKEGNLQHWFLVRKLKCNDVFMLPSLNKGYLSLEKATGIYKGNWANILYNTKPKKKGIVTITKV